MEKLETEGIPAVLAEHGLTWDRLNLQGATLYYRRRLEDMPLADGDATDPAKLARLENTRRKILEKAMQKYCFTVEPLRSPVGIIVEQGRLAGLRFQKTKVENGRAVPIAGAFEDVHAPLVVSSIGSVPEPMAGITMRNELYQWADTQLGRLQGYGTVFSVGNVVTGKGNIIASRKHSVAVSTHVIERFLGLGNGKHDGEEALAPSPAGVDAAAQKIADVVKNGKPLAPAVADALLGRVRSRQEAVGYTGSYREWLERVTPHDLA